MLITNAAIFREIVGTLVLDHTVSDSTAVFFYLLSSLVGWLAGWLAVSWYASLCVTAWHVCRFLVFRLLGLFFIRIVTFLLQKKYAVFMYKYMHKSWSSGRHGELNCLEASNVCGSSVGNSLLVTVLTLEFKGGF
jgi:hypothetical protein